MITLNSTYSLIAKMGEALATTQPDYVINYGKPYIRREQGTASEVMSHEIAVGAMNSTTNVTLLAATTTGTPDRYIVESLSICNRDTVTHTISVSMYDGTTERRIINSVYLPVNNTLIIDAEGVHVTGSSETTTLQALSGSTNGKAIKVVQTATLGTTIHTAVSSTTAYDRIRLWVVNSDTTDRKLTIEYGGATSPDNLIEMTIPAEDGLFEVTPPEGLILNNAQVVTAFAATANVLMVYGYAERINA